MLKKTSYKVSNNDGMHLRGNAPLKEKGYCSHCSRDGHHEATCWALHPDLRPKRDKKTKQTSRRETASQAVLQ
jgi:hypothetical protein